jgi:hypothetical protein
MYYIATVSYENETDKGTIKKTKEKVLIEAESAEEATILANKDAAEDSRSSELISVVKSPIGYIVSKQTTPVFYGIKTA